MREEEQFHSERPRFTRIDCAFRISARSSALTSVLGWREPQFIYFLSFAFIRRSLLHFHLLIPLFVITRCGFSLTTARPEEFFSLYYTAIDPISGRISLNRVGIVGRTPRRVLIDNYTELELSHSDAERRRALNARVCMEVIISLNMLRRGQRRRLNNAQPILDGSIVSGKGGGTQGLPFRRVPSP